MGFLFISAVFLVFYFLFTKNTPFFTVKHPVNKDQISYPNGEILKGGVVAGNFEATNNNLGIVEIGFHVPEKPSSDVYIFRLKESGQENWIYENTYFAKQFGGYPLFPFGFPLINESKGKKYYFELISLNGEVGKAVAINDDNAPFITKYIFNKQYFKDNPKEISAYLFQKIQVIIYDTSFLRLLSLVWTLEILFFLILNSDITSKNLEFTKMIKKRSDSQKSTILNVLFYISNFIREGCHLLLQIIFSFFKLLYFFYRWLGEK